MTDIGTFLVRFGGSFFLFGFIVIVPVTWSVTVRYYDNVLGFKDKFYNPFGQKNILPVGMMRALQYAPLIVLKKSPKKSYDSLVFGEANFREKSRRIDVFLGYLVFVMVYGGFCISGIGTCILFLDKFLTWLFQ
jgi:hypothetical protein